jgi:alkanesulfonate monooxygenase SsuD/methylene tetrahydromethanopterin reductase-like flavin-dependent oxidoreductase (luciferase family)
VDPSSISLDIPKEMIMDLPQGGWQVISPTTERRNPGMRRPFRFGVVAPLRTDLPTWRARVRRIADSGYSTLLMPDVPQWQPAPGPTLASAAAVADLRVGTWVYASPLRPAWMTAWEAHSLSVLTDGRFELGIGTGRPGIEDELREKGLPVVPPSERLAQVRETVRALRDLDGPDRHTPVVMAVRGPKARALAADVADTVTFTSLPDESRVEVARLARDFRAVRDLELALHVSVIGDTVAPFMAPPDTDPAAVRAADSLAMLPDDPAAAVEEIQRRREEIGFSYFVFGADFADKFAPVVAELAGR